jgi:hypothetical protein
MYSAIVSRFVADKGGPLDDPVAIDKRLANSGEFSSPCPDFIVAGRSNLSIGVVQRGGGLVVASPFLAEQNAALAARTAEGLAFGVWVTHLLWALESIFLGPIDYAAVLSDGLGLQRS